MLSAILLSRFFAQRRPALLENVTQDRARIRKKIKLSQHRPNTAAPLTETLVGTSFLSYCGDLWCIVVSNVSQ